MEKRRVVTPLEQSEPLVKRKRKKRIKNGLIIVIIFVICNLSLFLFLRSSFFTVKEISVKGLELVPREELFMATGVREGMNMWKISPPEIRNRALTIPQINEVEIEKVLPDKLVIDVEEKRSLALISYHGYYLELAHDGVIIGLRNEYEKELPLVIGLSRGQMDVGTSISNGRRGEIIEEFLEILHKTPSLPVMEINVEDPDQIIVYACNEVEIRLGSEEDLARKLEVMNHLYHRLLQSDTNLREGYLDLRAAEAPVFKPF